MSARPISVSAIAVACLTLVAWSSPAAAGQAVLPPSQCGAPASGVQSDGRIACVQTDTISVRELAERAAPLLWFSPDEQLLRNGGLGPETPKALPFDPAGPSPKGTVYYALSRVYIKERGQPFLQQTDVLDLRNVKGLQLEYYFYYPLDVGFGGHPHDLEQLTVTLEVRTRDDGGTVPANCRFAVYYARAEGWAHGSAWYRNVLRIESDGSQSDYSFPLTLLVEEGKHAVAPDRNGDGHYTPGYDVNRRVNDAWGVRDTLRGGDMAAPRYSASNTKPREPTELVGPELTVTTAECIYSAYRRGGVSGRPPDRYALRVVPAASRCDVPANRQFNLCAAMRERRTGDPPREETRWRDPSTGLLGTDQPVDRWIDQISVGYRRDGARNQIAIVLPFSFELRKVGGWVVPKFNVVLPTLNGSVDLTYTPSISRWADWYAAVGVELPATSVRQGGQVKAAMEVGLRLRFKIAGGFNGFRFGTRWNGFEQVENQRMIVEATIGPW